MRGDLRVLSPYRAQPAESGAHKRLGPFDWIAAIDMLRSSVWRACACETVALTDRDTNVGAGHVLRYDTTEPRLMLWILEASVRYLTSLDFDRDTVFVSPDTLVSRDLRPYFGGDLSLLVRTLPKYKRKPILNAVQWWPVSSKEKLGAFYTEVLRIGRTLPDNLQRWGADSEAIHQAVAPVAAGLHSRSGLTVQMLEAHTVMRPGGDLINASSPAPVVDFKGSRKQEMADYFQRAQWAS